MTTLDNDFFAPYRFYYTGEISDKLLKTNGFKPEEFDHLQDNLGVLFSGDPGAAQSFVALMNDRSRHPDREFKLTEIFSAVGAENTQPRLIGAVGKNPLSPEGLCCAKFIDIDATHKLTITASIGNDWLALKIPEKADVDPHVQYAFWNAIDKSLDLINHPANQNTFHPPVDVLVDPERPEITEKALTDWLVRHGKKPADFGLVGGLQEMLVNALTPK